MLSEWLQITLQMPLLVAPLLLLALLGLVIGGVYAYRRRLTQVRVLSVQVKGMENRLAQCVEQEAEWSFAGSAALQYPHPK